MRAEHLNALDIERFLDGCWRFRWPLAAALLVLACALWYWLMLGPAWHQLEALKVEHQDLQTDWQAGQRLVAALPSMRERIHRLGDALEQAAARLPSDTELAALLVDVSQAGVDAGLTFALFQPGDSTPRDFYLEQPIRLAVRGQYHQFGHFLEALAGLPRLVRLGDFEVRSMETDPAAPVNPLRFEAMLMTYRDAGSTDDRSDVPLVDQQRPEASVSIQEIGFERISTGGMDDLFLAPVRYLAGSGRDPFIWPGATAARSSEAVEVLPKDKAAGVPSRPRQPLEQYSLDQLRLVGRLDGGGRRWALVSVPDGQIHAVKIGDFLGHDQGRVARIGRDGLLLMERVADGAGAWRDRETRLELQP